MKIIFTFLFLSVFLVACGDSVKKPDNILSEDEVAELIAEFAINDQSFTIDPNINLENSTRFILNKYGAKGEQFTESYKYYMTKPNVIKDIYNKSQKIILSKDIKAEDYINKKLEGIKIPEENTQQ